MIYTQNYQLPQWVKSDRIMMDDFNDANSKIDAALHGLRTDMDSHAETLTEKGNCQIVFGTYTGTGTAGNTGATTLQFSAPPLFVAVMPANVSGTEAQYRLLLIRGAACGYTSTASYQCTVSASWSGNSVSWYNYGVPTYQCNMEGTQYCYIALINAAE